MKDWAVISTGFACEGCRLGRLSAPRHPWRRYRLQVWVLGWNFYLFSMGNSSTQCKYWQVIEKLQRCFSHVVQGRNGPSNAFQHRWPLHQDLLGPMAGHALCTGPAWRPNFCRGKTCWCQIYVRQMRKAPWISSSFPNFILGFTPYIEAAQFWTPRLLLTSCWPIWRPIPIR